VFDAIGKPEFKTDPRFVSGRGALQARAGIFLPRAAEGLKQKTTTEWVEIFDRLDVPAMPYHTLETLMQDPHLHDVGFFRKFDHPTEGRMIDMACNKSTAAHGRLPAGAKSASIRSKCCAKRATAKQRLPRCGGGSAVDGRLE